MDMCKMPPRVSRSSRWCRIVKCPGVMETPTRSEVKRVGRVWARGKEKKVKRCFFLKILLRPPIRAHKGSNEIFLKASCK